MNQRVLIAFVLFLVPVAGAQVYTVTDLGPLSPTAINIWGQVVGNLNGQAFIWTQFAGRKSLGKLPGGTSSYAASINDLGVVTGTADGLGTVISPDASIPNQECSDLTQSFLWTQRNGMQGLGAVGVPPVEEYYFFWCEIPFYGAGINDLGQVAGYTEDYGSDYQWALLRTSADGTTLFGGSWGPTFVNGISNTGQVVGQNSTDATLEVGHATSWNRAVSTDLGTLGGPDVVDYSSSANGVNDLGQVVGWSTTGPLNLFSDFGWTGSPPTHAVLWTRSGAIQDLGTLSGDTLSAASKINFFGQVIGLSGNTAVFNSFDSRYEVIGRPFIWSKQSGMRDLNSLISTHSRWVLDSATGINIWGQIVGSGTLNGQAHGFLLTPKVF